MIERYGKEWRDRLQAVSGSENGEEQIYVNCGLGDERPEVLYGARKLPRLNRVRIVQH